MSSYCYVAIYVFSYWCICGLIQVVGKLSGLHIHQAACGMNHSAVLATQAGSSEYRVFTWGRGSYGQVPALLLYVSSYYYICVLILLYVSSYYCMCPHTTICVLILLYVCVLILLYMCPDTAIYFSSYYYIYVCSDSCICSWDTAADVSRTKRQITR